MNLNNVFLDVLNLSGIDKQIGPFFTVFFAVLGFSIFILLLIVLFSTKNKYAKGIKSKSVYRTAIIMNLIYDVIYVLYITICVIPALRILR